MSSTISMNAPAAGLLEDMAAELAFVDPSTPASVLGLQGLVQQLAESLAGQAPPGVYELLDWFDAQVPAQWQAGATSAQVQALYDWYEQLAQAWVGAVSEPAALDEAASRSGHVADLVADFHLDPPVDLTALGSAVPSDQAPAEPVELPTEVSTLLTLNLAQDAELLAEFCIEGRELLQNIEQGVLVLEDRPDHAETLNTVFRAFHTFKGGAGFLALAPIKDLAHELESLLDAARSGSMPISARVIELILAGGDVLGQFVAQISHCLDSNGGGAASSAEIAGVPTQGLLARVKSALRGEPAPDAPLPAASVVTEAAPFEPAVAQAPASANQPAKPASPTASLTSASQNAGPRSTPKLAAPGPATPTPAMGDEGGRNVVRLDTGKIDALVDLVGELLIAQSMVVQHPDVLALQGTGLSSHLRQLARITSDLQRNAMSLRMVPLRTAFRKMNRLVRDLAAAQGKQINLQLVGEDIELDRNIVEQLGDPLIHMVRNAVDHGIELPAQRLAKGKPEQGAIKLEALQQGGGIVIRISDDGRGMDQARIVAKAMERGVVDADFAGSEKEIFDLIFAPGFSTAESLTDVSGRGVGMDVVRSSITRMRGRVDVHSVLGEGSIFTLNLPLTLAIIDGMLVRVGRERFIIPTLSIRESVRPSADSVFTVQGKGEVINVRGKLIPLLRLAHELGLQGQVQVPHEGIVVVVESAGRSLGVLVDQLLGKNEVIIKSLGSAFSGQHGMSGAAILGDGLVSLIVDPDALGRHPALTVASLAAAPSSPVRP